MDILTSLIFDVWSVLAQSLIFGIVLTLAVRLALGILAPANASTRFAVWFATLIAISVLPLAFFARNALPGLLKRAPSSHTVIARIEVPAVPSTSPGRAAVQSDSLRVHAPARATYDRKKAFQTQLLLPDEVAFGVLSISAFLIALLFGRIGISYLRLRRLKAGTCAAPPEVQKRFESWLSLCKTLRPVRLSLSTKARSPMAVGFTRPAVIIPDSLLLRLTGEELDHLGLHELAHVRRYDDWTNLAQRIIQAVFFFHPAVHWICRKLDFEREVACDDWVLTLTGAAKPYARSLAKVLECSPWQRGPALASGAVFRKRQILRRIEMLLDGSRDSKPRVSQVTFVVILMCVFGAFTQIVQMPELVAFGNAPGGSFHRSRWNVDGRTIELEIRGDVQFGDDDISVRTLSPGGYLKLREHSWTRREVEIRSGNSTQPDVIYRVDGRERPLDEKGREWMAALLPTVIRETGIHAEERALRILRKRGAAGVFEEIDRISSDHSRRQYLSAVVRSGELNPDDLRRAMNRIARISSDHHKANLLLEVASVYASEQLRGAYFDALNTINSDHDRRRVLTQVIEDSRGDAALLAQAGRSVERMSSDHDKAALLRLSSERITSADPEARRSLMRAAASINSDHDKANVLSALLGPRQLPAEVLDDLLRLAAKIQSDHHKAQVLGLAVQQDLSQASTRTAFFAAVDTINSDHHRAQVLEAVIEQSSAEGLIDDLARSAQGISSDHHKANVLRKLASRAGTTPFVDAVRSINSDSDKRRVLEAMLERAESAAAAKNAVALAATLGSDHDKAQVLLKLAEKHRDDPEVRDAVRKAAEKISSDSDYRRIMSKLLADTGESVPKRGE